MAKPVEYNATLAERIAWHLEHQKECACRPIPAKLLAQMPAAGRKKAAAKKAAANKTATTSKLDPKFDRVIAAFAEDPQVSSGKMMASVGLKVNGKIFAMLVKGKFVAKLPKERVNELVESGKGEYFDPRNDAWGAFELGVRYSDLRVDADAFDLGFASRPESTRAAQAYTVGLNWYLNRNFKFMFNYEHTDFDTPVEFSSLRDKEDVIITRFAISY